MGEGGGQVLGLRERGVGQPQRAGDQRGQLVLVGTVGGRLDHEGHQLVVRVGVPVGTARRGDRHLQGKGQAHQAVPGGRVVRAGRQLGGELLRADEVRDPTGVVQQLGQRDVAPVLRQAVHPGSHPVRQVERTLGHQRQCHGTAVGLGHAGQAQVVCGRDRGLRPDLGCPEAVDGDRSPAIHQHHQARGAAVPRHRFLAHAVDGLAVHVTRGGPHRGGGRPGRGNGHRQDGERHGHRGRPRNRQTHGEPVHGATLRQRGRPVRGSHRCAHPAVQANSSAATARARRSP